MTKEKPPEPKDERGRGLHRPEETMGAISQIIERSMKKALGVKKTASKKCRMHGVYVSSFYEKDGEGRWTKCPDCCRERIADQAHREHHEKFVRARQRAGNRLISDSGIPVRFAMATFENYHVEEGNDRQAKAVKVCHSFVDNFRACLDTGASMVMMGDVGTGKTHLACAMVKEISRRYNATTTYITAARMYRALKATYGGDKQAKEQDVINEFVHRELLVIDELGISYNSQAEKVLLFDIINGRYELNRPTIIVTNIKTKEKLEEWLTKPVYDRLTERGRAVLFDWDSYRSKVY